MENVPNYGPWHEGKDATPEELAKMYPKRDLTQADVGKMAILYYSPPFCPMEKYPRELWDTLLSAGIMDVRITIKDGKVGFVVSKDQTITLKKGEFYPIEPCGGETQQKVAMGE